MGLKIFKSPKFFKVTSMKSFIFKTPSLFCVYTINSQNNYHQPPRAPSAPALEKFTQNFISKNYTDATNKLSSFTSSEFHTSNLSILHLVKYITFKIFNILFYIFRLDFGFSRSGSVKLQKWKMDNIKE